MIRFLAAALILLFSFSALAANPYPALLDVVGVSRDDVLNIRNTPSGSGDKIGSLTFDQRNVEIVGTDTSGRWGMVNLNERTGWVAMRFLQRRDANEYALPQELHCSGTEPFWSLSVLQGQSATFSIMGEMPVPSPAGQLTAGIGRIDRYFLGLGDNGFAILRRDLCHDGMSDQAYGLDIDLITDGNALFSGCCSIAPR